MGFFCCCCCFFCSFMQIFVKVNIIRSFTYVKVISFITMIDDFYDIIIWSRDHRKNIQHLNYTDHQYWKYLVQICIIHFGSIMSRFLLFFNRIKCIMLKYCVVFSFIRDVGKSYKLLKKHFSLDLHQCIDHEITSVVL